MGASSCLRSIQETLPNRPAHANPVQPNVSVAQFPPNAVSMKLLFTEATPDQVPYLAGSKQWQAYIFVNPQNQGPGAPRVIKTLRLLQVDVAVRDPRFANTTGWVFGTFIYDGRITGNDPYKKLRPVGVMWGNDPTLGPSQYQQGARTKQTRLNPVTKGIMRHYGWLGRLDGPVDNPKSSCFVLSFDCSNRNAGANGSTCRYAGGFASMDELVPEYRASADV